MSEMDRMCAFGDECWQERCNLASKRREEEGRWATRKVERFPGLS
jgi:hypothetical protein